METTNKLHHVINRLGKDGKQYNIVIKLDDECNNGHADFSITGTIWEAGKPKTERNIVAAWAIGDRIAAEFPDMKIFDALHLCDCTGAPMYAVGNGYYHLHNSPKETAINYLRCSEAEYELFKGCGDEHHFWYWLQKSGLVSRWNREAAEAIAQLETYTGKKYVDTSKKFQFTPMTTDEIAVIETKMSEGFYSAEAIQYRKNMAAEAAIQEAKDDLKEYLDKEVKKQTDDYNVKLAVLNAGGIALLENFIYYNHTNEGCFNWKSYGDAVTQEQFDEFLKVVNVDGLPKGITWKLKP